MMAWLTKMRNVADVAEWRLCLGCGACRFACPEMSVQIVNLIDSGLRPLVDDALCKACGTCLEVCPGINIVQDSPCDQTIHRLRKSWGGILEIWEGYAVDAEIRYRGSSGGVATALALYCLEKEKAGGVLHVAPKEESPLENVPLVSKTRDDLLKRTGSRYAPAAPCEGLELVTEEDEACVFIGKPCDVVALRKCQKMSEGIQRGISLAISIFCAGTPATRGTHTILNTLDVIPENVKEIRYRGCGWPGSTQVTTVKQDDSVHRMSYQEAWGNILSKHSAFRCRLCPDSTGEQADISCGDPWYRDIQPGENGSSLVLVRTELGRNIVRKAIQKGYVFLTPVSESILPLSQKALLKRRQHLFGRLLALRVAGVPVPKLRGFSLLKNWLNLSTVNKCRSLGGTLYRSLTRGWRQPNPLDFSINPEND